MRKRYQSFRSWGVISLRSRRAFSNWVLSFGIVIGCPLRPRYARPPLPRGEARCIPGYFSPSGTRYARPPLPRGEARCIPGYFSPSGTRYARPPLPRGEARCIPGYFSPSGTRCARPSLPKGEARDARTVHRKVYKSALLSVRQIGVYRSIR